MRTIGPRQVVRAFVFVGLFGIGCAHPAAETKMVEVKSTGSAVGCAADVDCGQRQLCVDATCHDIVDNMAECGTTHVHFKTNVAELDRSDTRELDRTARCLKSDRSIHVTVAGNADERGNEAINQTLGMQRAEAVSAYLEAAGVRKAQIDLVDYGKDSPLCRAHDEACWKRNRRAEVTPTGVPATPINGDKKTSHDNAKSGNRIPGTGNGTDNGDSLGK